MTCNHFARACCVRASNLEIIVKIFLLPVPYKSLDPVVLGYSCSLFGASVYQAVQADSDNMAAKEVGMSDDNSDWIMCAVS